MPTPAQIAPLIRRSDEIGTLARALERLQHDVTTRFTELHTLLETSKVVVDTLDPHTVVTAIIREVQRLVDVQAAAMLVPNADGVLRVLASAGRSPSYDQNTAVEPGSNSPTPRALLTGQPVQVLADGDDSFPPRTRDEGFQVILAIPMKTPHAHGMVLVVHRA